MKNEGGDVIKLDEFRLLAADEGAAAARIVAAASTDGSDPPLLTSIDDPHDVAVLRMVPEGSSDPNDPRAHAALGRLVAAWQRPKHYRPRIAVTSEVMEATSYRLAVTESGVNDEPSAAPSEWFGEVASGEPVATLIIGIPVGTHAGLLVLVGRAGSTTAPEGVRHWPLPLSRELGVRVYEG
jgi:hypothetical protein